MATDYTDPSTVDVDVVMGNITGDYQVRGHLWTDKPSWPNVTVKALTDEIQRLRAGEGTAPQAPAEVLWEGETSADGVKGPPLAPGWSILNRAVPVPPGTRVRLIAADGAPQPEADLLNGDGA